MRARTGPTRAAAAVGFLAAATAAGARAAIARMRPAASAAVAPHVPTRSAAPPHVPIRTSARAARAPHVPLRFAVAAVAMAAALAGAAAAQGADAQRDSMTGATAEQMEAFRLCRAAVFYHRDARSAASAILPVAFADALDEQITFVMAATVAAAPRGTVEQINASMRFTERFFLEFSETIARRSDLARDVAERERLLISCAPLVWGVVSGQIDGTLSR